MRGDARQLFDQVGTDGTGNERRPTAEDLDAPHLEQLAGAHFQPAEMRGAETRLQSTAQGTADGVPLFRNLLAHEVCKVAFVVGFIGPLDDRRSLGRGAALEGHGAEALGGQGGHFAVIEMHHALRVTHQRPRVGGDEHLVVADADDDGTAIARDDDGVGAFGIDHRESVGAADHGERGAHRILERLLGRRGDQVGHDFRIGLRQKLHALRGEAGPQLRGVFDDAVVDDGEALRTVGVRVRVPVARLAVRRPAGVRDAGAALELGGQRVLELANATLALVDAEFVAPHQRDAGRIVAAVLQPVQTLEEDRRRIALADVTDYAAHDVTRRSDAESGARCILPPGNAAAGFPGRASGRSLR